MRISSEENADARASMLLSGHGMIGLRRENDHSEFEATLLAMAGHDLRQPLQIIQRVHEHLGLDAETGSELRLLQFGQDAINRLTRQLDQLLDALRLREQARNFQQSPVGLDPLLREAHRENEWSALQKGIQFRLVPTSSWVMSDAVLLSAALRNLVGNAIKYTKPGGQVLLGSRRLQNSVRIDVLDTGIGISDEHVPKIFEAFTRLDAAQGDGLGVGLFIVRQAISILAHRIEVSSVVSRGTRFSIFARRV
jgi:two-component system phosphate regulon sensor histidine kinase PhoR